MQVKAILVDVLEKPQEAWRGYVAAVCGGDVGLRSEIESLLMESADDLDRFLETPVFRAPPVPDSWVPPESGPPRPGAKGTLRVLDLPPYTGVCVRTRSNDYRLLVVAPLEATVLIEGGRKFSVPTKAQLLDDGTLAVGKRLRLRFRTRNVVTTPVTSIDIIS